MPAKGRIKKTSQEDPASRREDQRRLRNRLSQKAVRERRAARIQQLEQQLATVTKGGDGARVNELLKINSKLRHALLDTRKRLASLSATAAQLSEGIKLILDDNAEDEQSCADVPNQEDAFDGHSYSMWNNDAAACSQSPATSSTESICINQEPDPFPNADIELINAGTDLNTEATNMDHMVNSSHDILSSMEAMFEGSRDTEVLRTLFPSPPLGPKLQVYSGSTFSQHLDHIHGLLRLGGVLQGGSSIPKIVDTMVSAFLEHGWPSLQCWFDVTQSLPLATRVLWWQTSNSREAAFQVPPGNAPTLIQLSQPKYPCILDWVPHPGLRDLLILNYEAYEVDQVVCDMTNAFVVEVEDSASPVGEQSDFASATNNKGYSYNLMELVERTLIFGPIDSESQQFMRLLRSPMSTGQSLMDHPVHRFKLDPRFFDKYPALYDANAVSKYRPRHPPLIEKSQLPLPFTTHTVMEYMNAALHAKATLIAA